MKRSELGFPTASAVEQLTRHFSDAKMAEEFRGSFEITKPENWNDDFAALSLDSQEEFRSLAQTIEELDFDSERLAVVLAVCTAMGVQFVDQEAKRKEPML